jgi:hypothetical protein
VFKFGNDYQIIVPTNAAKIKLMQMLHAWIVNLLSCSDGDVFVNDVFAGSIVVDVTFSTPALASAFNASYETSASAPVFEGTRLATLPRSFAAYASAKNSDNAATAFPVGAIVGIAIGAFGLIVLVVVLVVWNRSRKQQVRLLAP